MALGKSKKIEGLWASVRKLHVNSPVLRSRPSHSLMPQKKITRSVALDKPQAKLHLTICRDVFDLGRFLAILENFPNVSNRFQSFLIDRSYLTSSCLNKQGFSNFVFQLERTVSDQIQLINCITHTYKLNYNGNSFN